MGLLPMDGRAFIKLTDRFPTHLRIAPIDVDEGMPLPELPAPNPRWALFLDVDGTLIEIAKTPKEVCVEPEVRTTLRRLSDAFNGAVALVSGRPIETIDQLFQPLHLPTAGLHGIEVRNAADATYRVSNNGSSLKKIRETLEQFAKKAPGVLLEDKGTTLALHYRQAPEREEEAKALLADLLATHDGGYHCLHGKMVLEVKPSGINKGKAVEHLLTEAPFAGRIPVFIGDDVTDEDGFATVNRLGGHSIRVGENGKTVATFRIESVRQLRAWLVGLSEAILAGTEAAKG